MTDDVQGPFELPAAISPDLIADLKRDEGLRLKAYRDTLGVWTIGYGHAHVPPGTVWTVAQAEVVLIADIRAAQGELDAHLPWWRSLSQPRQDVLSNMCFNMGWPRLSGFRHMLAAADAGDYAKAADEMLASAWASQVGARASRLATQMRTGHWPA